MVNECVILADDPSALVELCGISTLERLLRTLQRCGIERATVLSSTPDPIAKELARPSWARARLNLTLRTRPAGPVRLEQIVDLWPRNSDAIPLLLVIPAGSVFDPRLLRALVSQNAPTVLVDSGVGPRIQALIASAPDTARGKLCGPALLEYDWASAQIGFLKRVCATDWSTIVWPRWMSPLSPYTTSRCVENSGHIGFLRHRFRIENWQSAFCSIQYKRAHTDIPAWFHAPIETFLVSRLCKTPITPNKLTLFCNVVAWTVTILLVTGHLAWGLGLALIVGVLDGLDGKLARLKLETSKAGKLEHLFDALFENSWWVALAWHLSVSGKLPDALAYLGLLIGAEVLNALARASIVRYYGKSISELASFDRIFRLVGGRRNIYVWILAIGLILGAVAGAFKLIAWWEAVTAAVNLVRVAWALWALRSQSASPLDSTRLLLLRADRSPEG